jgi:hypothetical protein
VSRRRYEPSPDAAVRTGECRCGQDLLPLSEVARRLDMSTYTLLRWHRLHALPLFRLHGAGYFALWSAVERWAHACERDAVAATPEEVKQK